MNNPTTEVNESAREFMAHVRREQAASQKPLYGMSGISAEQKSALFEMTSTSPVIVGARKAMEADAVDLAHLFERFEGMCRRRKVEIPEALRTPIMETLATELLSNVRELEAPAKLLSSATLYGGEIGKTLKATFPEHLDTPGIYRDAVRAMPVDPVGYITSLHERIERVSSNPEFAMFKDMPSVFSDAARKHPENTEDFLRGAIVRIREIEQSPEFSMFHDTPGIIRDAVFDHVKDPQGHLRKIVTRSRELAFDKDMEVFWKPSELKAAKATIAAGQPKENIRTPSIFKYAVANYGEGDRPYLLRVREKMQELMTQGEFADSTPGTIKLAAAKSSDPEGFLRAIQERFETLSGMEDLGRMSQMPGQLRYAATHFPKKPESYLKRKLDGAEGHAAAVQSKDDSGKSR